jgi:phage terminase small subunit
MEHDLAREIDEYVAFLDGVIHAVEVNVTALVATWDGSDPRALARAVDEAMVEAHKKVARSSRTAALETAMAETLVSTLVRSGSTDQPEQIVAKLLLLSERVADLVSTSIHRQARVSSE